MFDTQTIKANVDMLALVESNLGQCLRHNGHSHQWLCPFHGEKTPSFTVYSETRSWYCFGCHKGGDVIQWVQQYKGLDFKESCRYLQQFVQSRPPVPMIRPQIAKRKIAPTGDTWQSRASVLVSESQNRLWKDSVATDALAYLHERGFSDETIRNAQLGYNIGKKEQRTDWGLPLDSYADYVWVDNGIVIPFLSNGLPQRITIRRFPKVENAIGEERKYKVLSGSANILYNGDLLDPTLPALLTEGVFDALSVQQEAGDLIVSVATDSTRGARTPEWIEKLATLPLVLVAYDADEAGDRESEFWLKTLPNARRLRPLLDDPNAMLKAGMDIRQWVQNGLNG